MKIAHAQSAALTPAMLEWAISRAAVSPNDLARSVGTSEDVVTKWLDGRRKPSFRQLRAVASHLHVPFGFMFLPSPPPDTLPIPDFRTIQGRGVAQISLELRDVILSTMRRQAWLSEFRQDQGAEPNQFVASAAGSMSATGVASSIRRALGLTSVSDRPSNADDFLRDLVRRSEELGISVIRSGVVGSNTHRKLSVDEFRGFSLSDSFAPFIFVNGADVKPAQVFTLMHEMAHIWFGQTGISGDLRQADSALESLCNRVAAEVLVPAREFEQVWRTDLDDDEAIKMIARRFRVSRFVAAIRAYESGFIEEARLEELLESYRSSVRARTSEGGDYYRNAIVRNGRSFTTSVFNALARQTVLTGEASALLEVSPRRLGRLGEEIRGGG